VIFLGVTGVSVINSRKPQSPRRSKAPARGVRHERKVNNDNGFWVTAERGSGCVSHRAATETHTRNERKQTPELRPPAIKIFLRAARLMANRV
jgi:hypothetical protein